MATFTGTATTGELFLGSASEVDTVDYSASVTDLLVDLDPASANDPATAAAGAGDATDDIFLSIENILGGSGNDAIRGNSDVNQLEGNAGNDILDGRSGDDSLLGGAGDDRLIGNEGADALDGGDDIDTASYRNAIAGVTASLDDSSINTASAAGDTYINIENIEGSSSFGDVLSGDDNNNVVDGRGGNDELFGLGGDDSIVGGAGDDLLSGGAGRDILTGGSGSDIFQFAAGDEFNVVRDFAIGTDLIDLSQLGVSSVADLDGIRDVVNAVIINEGDVSVRINGLTSADVVDSLFVFPSVFIGPPPGQAFVGTAGDDLVDYSSSADAAGIQVDLDPTLANDPAAAAAGRGDSAGDSFDSIEDVIGTAFDDVIRGGDEDNSIAGGDGNDVLDGRGGDDILEGGDGDDLLRGRDGADTLDGGLGIDTASYRGATAGVTASLLDASGNAGDAEGDTYVDIENIEGSSSFGDVLSGDDNDNVVDGRGGNDFLQGNGGRDFLIGGGGNDTFIFTSSSDRSLVRDFESGVDKLLFSGLGVTSLDDFATNETANGNAILSASGVSVQLIGVGLADLDSGDFIFL